MKKGIQKISKNIKETQDIAGFFLDTILKSKKNRTGAVVVALSGDLGAGKTAFTQTLAKHLGVKNKITSPTFVILKKYPIKKSKDHKFLFHIDAYRLKSERELLYLGWEELISNQDNLILIEWPEIVESIIPNDAAYVYIAHREDGSRSLELKNN